jgi:hypothetical protein
MRRARVGAIEAVGRRGDRQPVGDVPLQAHFMISEALGLETLRDIGQRRELVAGARQERHAVARVERDCRERLEQHADARCYQMVHSAQR